MKRPTAALTGKDKAAAGGTCTDHSTGDLLVSLGLGPVDDTGDPIVQAIRYGEMIWGNQEGFAHIPLARSADSATTAKPKWVSNDSRYYRWPGDSVVALQAAIEDSIEFDVYVAPMLRRGTSIKKGSGIGGRYLWADIDVLTPSAVEKLPTILRRGSFVVASGTAGHLHVYVHLDQWLPAQDIEYWNRRLAQHLDADSKWSETSVLRLPGTFNHKRCAQGGAPAQVQMWVSSRRRRQRPPWSIEELNLLLPPLPAKRPPGPVSAVEPAALPATTPGWLLTRLKERALTTGEGRSGQLFSLIGAGIELGFTDEECFNLGLQHEPSQEKYEERLEDEVLRVIEKLRVLHPHDGTSCWPARCGSYVDRRRPLLTRLAALQIGFVESRHGGITTGTDTAVLDALIEKSIELEAVEFDFSSRDLAIASGITDRQTVSKSIKRLSNFVELVRQGKPGIAARYRLRVDNFRPYRSHALSLWLSTYGLKLDSSHDAVRWRGLGKNAVLTWQKLAQNGSQTLEELAGDLPFKLATVRRHLTKLADNFMAEQQDSGVWMALDRPLEIVAKELGTQGTRAKQVKLYEDQRAAQEERRVAWAKERLENQQQPLRWYPPEEPPKKAIRRIKGKGV